MDKIIKEQIDKINKYYNLNITETDTCIHIPKDDKRESELKVNEVYRVRVKESARQSQNYREFQSSWNNGNEPPERAMTIKVIQILGKMVRMKTIDGISNWDGWVLIDDIVSL